MKHLWIGILCIISSLQLVAETRNLGDGRTETINGNSYTFQWKQNFNNGGSVNVTMTGTIKDGKKDGIWKISGTWNKCPVSQNDFYTGTATMTRSYNNGVPNGAYSLNYGLKHMTGRYVPKLGTWQYSAPNNVTVTASGNFKNGKPDGVWKMSNARTGKNYTMTFHNGRPDGSFDNGDYVFDDGLLLIRKYNGVAGYALIDEIKNSFDRNANEGKDSFPLIDQGMPTAPDFYMKGGDFAEWLGRYGGQSFENPIYETFEPQDEYIRFDNIKQLDDPEYVQKEIEANKRYKAMQEDAELAQKLEKIVSAKADSIKKSEIPITQFINHILGLHADKFYAQQILENEYPDFKEKIKGYGGSAFSYFNKELPDIHKDFYGNETKGYSYQDRLNIIDTIYNLGLLEAKSFLYNGSQDSLQNMILSYFRPAIKKDGFSPVLYDADMRKRDSNSKDIPSYVKFLFSNYPLSYGNTDEWYKFIFKSFHQGVKNGMKLTREDIEGYVVDNLVSQNGNKFKVQSPKKNSISKNDIFEYVYKKRLGLKPENALTADYRKNYYATWSIPRNVYDFREKLSLYEVSQALSTDKKYNKVVDELSIICGI